MGKSFFRVPGSPYWNVMVITAMVAAVSVAYALAETAEAVASHRMALVLRVAALAMAMFSFLLLYARFVEPFWIVVNRARVPFPVAGLRVAVIGDFHVGPHKTARFVERTVARTNALRPDLVFLVGDFLYDHTADIEHLEPLRHLHAAHGVFAVTGNHDSSHDHLPGKNHTVTNDRTPELAAAMRKHGIHFLRNESVRVPHASAPFAVAGIDDLWMESCDLRRALKDVPTGEPCMLLSHQPDIILDPLSHRAELIVSGHTHGGQMRLPFLGSLSHIPQRLSKKFDRGIFAVGAGTTLAITHGIGETFVPLRFLARPEILLLETV